MSSWDITNNSQFTCDQFKKVKNWLLSICKYSVYLNILANDNLF